MALIYVKLFLDFVHHINYKTTFRKLDSVPVFRYKGVTRSEASLTREPNR
jgi:hypothetical protein